LKFIEEQKKISVRKNKKAKMASIEQEVTPRED